MDLVSLMRNLSSFLKFGHQKGLIVKCIFDVRGKGLRILVFRWREAGKLRSVVLCFLICLW